VTAGPDMCYVRHYVSSDHMFFFFCGSDTKFTGVLITQQHEGYGRVTPSSVVSCYDSYAVASLPHVICTRKKNNGSEGDIDLADEERYIGEALSVQVYNLIPLNQNKNLL
jgi:hypothetical protein